MSHSEDHDPAFHTDHRRTRETVSVVDARTVGAYRWLRLRSPSIARTARPGQFLAVAVGEEPTSTLLRRVFSVHRADPGEHLVDIVVAAKGTGSQWVTQRERRTTLDVAGPLGRPFPDPEPGRPVLLVGGGYGAAPLTWFAEGLRDRGVDVRIVLGAATETRVFGVPDAVALLGQDRVHVCTEDGSLGVRGRVTDLLDQLLPSSAEPSEVYACGPMGMLRAVTELTVARGSRAWCTVEESMACGIGVCMTCVLPVRGTDGTTRMVRSCVEGPTFEGSQLRWEAIGGGPGGRGSAVPEDCLGAPAGTTGA
jgi:dihydroorotate dehydrogenase electron transfer subunit